MHARHGTHLKQRSFLPFTIDRSRDEFRSEDTRTNGFNVACPHVYNYRTALA